MKHVVVVAGLLIAACGGAKAGGDGAAKPDPTSPVAAPCVKDGCSGTVCRDADAEPTMTTCEYQAAYACYETATCAPQPDGVCGWSPTTALTQCLANPPEVELTGPLSGDCCPAL